MMLLQRFAFILIAFEKRLIPAQMVVSKGRKILDFCTFRFTKLYKSFCRLYYYRQKNKSESAFTFRLIYFIRISTTDRNKVVHSHHTKLHNTLNTSFVHSIPPTV